MPRLPKSDLPTPASASPAPAPATPAAMAPGSGLPVEVAAGLAEMFTLPGGLVMYLLDRRDPFVRFHALQSLILGVIGVLGQVVLHVIMLLLGKIPWLGTLFVSMAGFVADVFVFAWVVAYLFCTVGAFLGKWWRLPWTPAPPPELIPADQWERQRSPTSSATSPVMKTGASALRGMATMAGSLYARYRKSR